MLKRIALRDFMSHEETTIELQAPGLNVVAGKNNIGKSAVYEALRCLATGGRASDYVIRHSAKEARVEVETDDGHVVAWTRKRSGAMIYEVDGVRFDRAGGNVPPEVAKALRLDSVVAGDGPGAPVFEVHLAPQKEPLFLVGAKPQDVARFFAESSDARWLLKMRQLHRASSAKARETLERVRAEKKALDEELLRLEPLDGAEAALGESGARRGGLEKGRARAAALGQAMDAIAQGDEAVARGRAKSEALGRTLSPPELGDARPLSRAVRMIGEAEREFDAQRRREAALSPLAAPPDVEPSRPLADAALRLRRQEETLAEARSRSRRLASLPEPPSIAGTATLGAGLAHLRAAVAALAASRGQAAKLGRLAAPPEPPRDTAAIRSAMRALADAERRLAEARQEERAAAVSLERSTNDLDAFARELGGRCPLCGGDLRAGHWGERASEA